MSPNTLEEQYHFRQFDTNTDVPRLVQLLAEIESVDHAGEDISIETLQAQLSLPGHNPSQDRWVVTTSDNDEQLLGVGIAWKVPENKYADIYVGVHPAWRKQGIGGALLQRLIARAQTLQARDILASTDVQHRDAVDFLRKRAFSPIAAYTALQLANTTPVPQPVWPIGYSIRAYNPANDFPLLLDMYNRAFQGLWGHWEHVTAENLHGFMEGMNPAGISLLFTQAGEVVGTCHGETNMQQLSERRGKRTGYLDSPGVVPEQRANNLYLPLLLHAANWVCGQEPVDIEMESWGDDPQVLAQYQAVGFEKVQQQDIYRWQGNE